MFTTIFLFTAKPKPGQGPANEPPKFTRLLQDQAMKTGDRITFSVEFTGVPQPNVSWMLNGNPLQRTSDINVRPATSASAKMWVEHLTFFFVSDDSKWCVCHFGFNPCC